MFLRLTALVLFALPALAQDRGATVVPRAAADFIKEKKLALIIGINDYQEETGLSKLKYAVNDANDLAKALQAHGYTTDVLLDGRAIKVTIRRHLQDMLSRVESSSGTVLFAFSGHGGKAGGVDYLATYDASAESLASDGIPVDWIKSELAKSSAPRKMMFLDACRNVTAPGGKDTAAPVEPFARLADSRGLRMLISTAEGTRSYESDDLKHGVFTHFLLTGLGGAAAGSDGLITFNRLADYVTAHVKESRPGQVPYTDGQATGDFFLGGEFKTAPRVSDSGVDLDLDRYNAVRESRDPAVLEREAEKLTNPELIQVLRLRAATMRSLQETNQQASSKPKSPQAAALREKADAAYDKKDYAAAFGLYRQLAQMADAWGMFRVGVCFAFGEGIPENTKDALDWLHKAIDAGEPRAYNTIGTMYESGRGVPKDEVQAVSWYRKAADAGLPVGMTNMGRMYASGGGVAKNNAEALSWFRKAAATGYAPAMYYLGAMYHWGDGVGADPLEAASWYRKAAEGGMVDAMDRLARMFVGGDAVARNYDQAIFWFRKASETGDLVAMTDLGYMYENGLGVTADSGQAAKLYKQASDGGYVHATVRLGRLYALGRGVPQDNAQASEFFRKAADAGDADGMSHLGYAYLTGKGAPKDYAQASTWLRKAAEYGDTQAMVNLGGMYEMGEGFDKDPGQAVLWYRKAAEAGDSGGMCRLGTMYMEGRGAAKDTALGFDWLRKSAEGGDVEGMANLAYAYGTGTGVDKNVPEAVRWARKAADGGSATAMNLLGNLYESGIGVERDRVQALYWYSKGAQAGSQEAARNLARLVK